MASLANDPGGRRRILFVDSDGNRKAIRIGKMSKRQAEAVKLRVEDLIAARLSGGSPSDETSRWVAKLESALHNRLSAVGLCECRESVSAAILGPFVDAYIASRAKLKPNTLRNYQQTRRRLVDYFGETKTLSTITAGDADEWQQDLLAKLSPATVSRDVKRAKQFLKAAVRKRFMVENPFADLEAPAQVNDNREYFISREESQQVLDACPDAQWRLLFALARFGGLRTPSEPLGLKWGHVDWERNRLTVPSPKTEHHRKGASRTIPLFPELRTQLEACWAEAEDGAEYIITRYREKNANLRTQLQRILSRAGLEPWPKLFHNLRATRQTELAADYPLHVVCAWIGNSATIANQHYLTVTDADYEQAASVQTTTNGDQEEHPKGKAAQNAAQSVREQGSLALQEKNAESRTPLVLQSDASQSDLVHNCIVPPRGVEPLSPP